MAVELRRPVVPELEPAAGVADRAARGRIDALADPAEESGKVLAQLAFALEPKPLGDRPAEVDVSRPGAAVVVGEDCRTAPPVMNSWLKSCCPMWPETPISTGKQPGPRGPIFQAARPSRRGQFAGSAGYLRGSVGAMSVVPLSEKMSWFTEIWAVTKDVSERAKYRSSRTWARR